MRAGAVTGIEAGLVFLKAKALLRLGKQDRLDRWRRDDDRSMPHGY
jgi:hypothetical protein